MATYYFRNVNGNWNLAANWSLSSGGGSDGAVPNAADTAILDGNSGSCTVTGASNCLNLTITGYTNTLTMNNTITLATSGTFTIGTTFITVSGSSAILLSGTNFLTSGVGGYYDGLITFNGGTTKTLNSDFSAKSLTVGVGTTLNGTFNLSLTTLTISSGGIILTFNNNTTVYTQNLFTNNSTISINAGGTGSTIVFTGTGSWSGTSIFAVSTNIIFNSTQTTLIGTVGVLARNSINIIYSGGTIITTNSTLQISSLGVGTISFDTKGSSIGGATTISSTGINFNNLTLATNVSLNCISNVCVVGTFSPANSATNNSTIYVGGNLSITYPGSGPSILGNTPIVMNGTGTWSMDGLSILQKNVSINTSGTITLSGTLRYINGTITYTSGIINVGSSVFFTAGATIVGSMSFNTLIPSATTTFNVSPSNINTLTITAATSNFTSSGTVGFIANTFSSTTTGVTITLKTGTTYTVNSSLILTGASTSPINLVSSTTSATTFFNLTRGATQRVAFVTATDINSSGGQTIWDYKGTLTRTTNWNLLTTPITLSKTFVY